MLKLKEIEIEIYNNFIVIDKAVLRVQTCVFGLRYVMREWFYTVIFVVVAYLTSIQLIMIAIVYFKSDMFLWVFRKFMSFGEKEANGNKTKADKEENLFENSEETGSENTDEEEEEEKKVDP